MVNREDEGGGGFEGRLAKAPRIDKRIFTFVDYRREAAFTVKVGSDGKPDTEVRDKSVTSRLQPA